MKTLLIIAALFCVYKILSGLSAKRKEQAREEAEYQRQTDAAILRQEWREMQEKARLDILKREAEYKEQERLRKQAEREREELRKEQERQAREQERQAKEQTRLAKEEQRIAREQERQAAQLERHEEQLMKLDHRLASAESEIAFNREQIERIFKLQEFEISARDACSYGSDEWQKHEKKVISLENQIHTFQKRIDKAKADKRYCESKLA